MRPRLVATDLDGTLLHSDGTVTERTRSALAAVEAQGVTVVFVTGRPMRWMESLWTYVGDHGLAICSNGAVVFDVAAQAVRETRPISADLVLEVAGRLRTGIPGTAFALERLSGAALEPGFLARRQLPEDVQTGQLEDLLDETTVKILARHEDREREHFWREVEALVGDLVTTTWASSDALVEISGPGVTKAATLEALCAGLGVGAHQVLAFGDMPNDLAMLEWAGTSYAMANAHPLALATADHVAPDHDLDGVASVLERVFDLR